MLKNNLNIAFLKNKWKNFCSFFNNIIFFLFLNLHVIKKSNINIFFIAFFVYTSVKNNNFCLSEFEKEVCNSNNNTSQNFFLGFLVSTIAVGAVFLYNWYVEPTPDIFIEQQITEKTAEKTAIQKLNAISFEKIYDANPYEKKMPDNFFFPKTRFFWVQSILENLYTFLRHDWWDVSSEVYCFKIRLIEQPWYFEEF